MIIPMTRVPADVRARCGLAGAGAGGAVHGARLRQHRDHVHDHPAQAEGLPDRAAQV